MPGTPTFHGEGLLAGIELARAIQTGGPADFRQALTSLLFEVLSFVGLAAVISIIIAGMCLVFGGATEESRNRAKKIVSYTLVGLLVIILSSEFVAFVVAISSGV